MTMTPLEIEYPCPRGYETVTGIWEESGVPDHCAGCGCTMKVHEVELQRQIDEQVVLDKEGETPRCNATTSADSVRTEE